MVAELYPGWGISPRGQGFVVTEEFRSHTVLTVLAAMGGLWTLLSSLFSWLFGRSILFPIFGERPFLLFSQRISYLEITGNKPISPFGLIGYYSSDLRKKLDNNFGVSMRRQIQDGGFNRFLWDFVIDMNPLKFPEYASQTTELHTLFPAAQVNHEPNNWQC